ncbi:hypothetical protein Ahy_A09g041579 [Arachis hypogaea]|uniref:SWIM-type domain-containing protein n=1 Tax=Arachis hypogaea TaxID=3818 RepID=A0A445BD53_ARAHY|nr:hypothetical protein Ahy_A09g041579 [Arachis hypogaea]
MPLGCVDLSSDNDDDISPSNDRRKRKADTAEVMFEVHGEPHNVVVDLGNQTCSWLPCRHVIVAISMINGRPENYAHAWLTIESYNKIYEYHINPVRGQELWKTSQYLHYLPPIGNKSRGMSSHYARKKDAHEAPIEGSQEHTKTKLKEKYGKFTCGTCRDVDVEDAANESDIGVEGQEGEVVSAEGEASAEGGQTKI